MTFPDLHAFARFCKTDHHSVESPCDACRPTGALSSTARLRYASCPKVQVGQRDLVCHRPHNPYPSSSEKEAAHDHRTPPLPKRASSRNVNQKPVQQVDRSLCAFSFCQMLGTNTLFAAIGTGASERTTACSQAAAAPSWQQDSPSGKVCAAAGHVCLAVDHVHPCIAKQSTCAQLGVRIVSDLLNLVC